MRKRTPLLGKTFSRLTVIQYLGVNQFSQQVIKAKCICGQTITRPAYRLTTGRTKSCGCLRKDYKRIRRENARKVSNL